MKLVVENVPGATGAIGMTKVANAEPDGYTIGMGTSSTLALIAQGLTPLRNEQFAPIARVTTDPELVAQSIAVLRAYLEQSRAKIETKPSDRSLASGPVNGSGALRTRMSTEEALDVLGLMPAAGAQEILDAHRRLEQQLCRDYEATLDRLLENLGERNLEVAIEIASLPEYVRGFEQVREHQIEKVRAKQEELLAAYRLHSEAGRA